MSSTTSSITPNLNLDLADLHDFDDSPSPSLQMQPPPPPPIQTTSSRSFHYPLHTISPPTPPQQNAPSPLLDYQPGYYHSNSHIQYTQYGSYYNDENQLPYNHNAHSNSDSNSNFQLGTQAFAALPPHQHNSSHSHSHSEPAQSLDFNNYNNDFPIVNSELSPVESIIVPPPPSSSHLELTRPPSRSSNLSTPTFHQLQLQQQANELENQLFEHYKQNFKQIVMVHDDSEDEMWRDYVPDLASKIPALANGLLAVSALHLEKKGNNEKKLELAFEGNLTEFAFSQYTEAVTLFRDLQSEQGIMESEAAVACSVFIMILSYCFYDKIPLVSQNEHGLDLIAVTRGPMVITKSLWNPLMQSNFAKCVKSRIELEDPDPENEFNTDQMGFVDYLIQSCDTLEQLGLLDRNKEKYVGVGEWGSAAAPEVTASHNYKSQHSMMDNISSSTMPLDTTTDLDEFIKTENFEDSTESNGPIYRNALEQLKFSLKCTALTESPSMVMSWPMRIQSDFLSLARANYPFARIIMLYYLVSFQSIRQYFWVDDRPKIEANSLITDLGSQWQSFINWPMQMMNQHEYNITNIWKYFTEGAGPFDMSMLY